MRLVILISIVSLIIGCNNIENVVYYKYMDRYITRVDYSSETYLYEGKIAPQEIASKEWLLKVSYPGFNSGAAAYLVFENSNNFKIYRMYGKYYTNDSMRVTIVYNWFEDYEKVMLKRNETVKSVFVESSLVTERKINKKRINSNVETIYP